MTVRNRYCPFVICILASLIVVFSGTAVSAEHVSICPHKLVLNAEGQSDDVQAIVSIGIPPPYIIINPDVRLWFGDTLVATAESAFYCVIDDNLIIGFDRQELQEALGDIGLAGKEVLLTVEGCVNGVCFNGSDQVEIVQPGNKVEKK